MTPCTERGRLCPQPWNLGPLQASLGDIREEKGLILQGFIGLFPLRTPLSPMLSDDGKTHGIIKALN